MRKYSLRSLFITCYKRENFELTNSKNENDFSCHYTNMRILTLEEYNFFYNWICLKAITVKNKNLVTHSINFNNRLLIQKYLIYVAKRKKITYIKSKNFEHMMN